MKAHLVPYQLPEFYRSEGEGFVLFLEAYYQWLSAKTDVKLEQIRDIERTSEEFFALLRKQIAANFPANYTANDRHLLRVLPALWAGKGRRAAIEFLLRILFNDDAELHFPDKQIFTPSKSVWRIPRYIEFDFYEEYSELIGREVFVEDSNGQVIGSATIDSVYDYTIRSRIFLIGTISNLRGVFPYGARLRARDTTLRLEDKYIYIRGSTTIGYVEPQVSDIAEQEELKIHGLGEQGFARVTRVSTQRLNGLKFQIINGGSGYSLENSQVFLYPSLHIQLVNVTGTFQVNQQITNSTTGETAEIFAVNGSTLRVYNFTNPDGFPPGTIVTSSTGSGIVQSVLGNRGFGASFKVGEITGIEAITTTTIFINGVQNTVLEMPSNTFQLTVQQNTGTFSTLGSTVTSNAQFRVLEGSYLFGKFTNYELLSNTALGIANVVVLRDRDERLVWIGGSGITSANLTANVILQGSTSNARFQVQIAHPVQWANSTGTVVSSTVSGNTITLVVSSNNGFFIANATITSNVGDSGRILTSTRLTDWDFPGNATLRDNLDTPINEAIPFNVFFCGSIRKLTNVRPGREYVTPPYVRVVDPIIASLNIPDGNGGIKGNNAIIEAIIVPDLRVISGIEIIQSGYGYMTGESVTFISDRSKEEFPGVIFSYEHGFGRGYWNTLESFSSYASLFDGQYYSYNSYEIVSSIFVEHYRKFVEDLVSPHTHELFGRYKVMSTVTVSSRNTLAIL